MKLFLGTDHGGFAYKNALMQFLQTQGYDLQDLGAHALDAEDDYPVFAHAVAEAVAAHPDSYGILFCRSGEGMAIAANRHAGIRAAVLWNEAVAEETRRDNHANIAVIPADFLSEVQAKACIETFLRTEGSQEPRHLRRIAQLDIPSHGR